MNPYILATLSALMISLGWLVTVPYLSLVALIGLIPLFIAIDNEDKRDNNSRKIGKKKKVYSIIWLFMFVWNLSTTYWLYNSTALGGVMAVVANSFLLGTFFFMPYFFYFKGLVAKNSMWYLLIAMWVGFEFFYFDSEISWPWLNMGNLFASSYKLVQWYEYTGILGGTLWVMLTNVTIYRLFKHFKQVEILTPRLVKANIILSLIIVITPIVISLVMYAREDYKQGEQKTAQVMVVQPNVDPYNEKFSGDPLKHLKIFVKLLKDKTQYDIIVLPETFIQEHIQANIGSLDSLGRKSCFAMGYARSVKLLLDSVKHYQPSAVVVTGCNMMKVYTPKETPDSLSETSRFDKRSGLYYDKYNSVLFIDSANVSSYHKSKLVIGVEKMPYTGVFTFFKDNPLITLGEGFGSLGFQKERFVKTFKDSIKVGAAICYESIYGEFFTEFVKKGANVICIITNDGWWKQTHGHLQHLSYARLRAIETKRFILRSANTGISAVVNTKGDFLETLPWWEKGEIREKIPLLEGETFYVKYGDWVGRIAYFMLVLFAIIIIKRAVVKEKEV